MDDLGSDSNSETRFPPPSPHSLSFLQMGKPMKIDKLSEKNVRNADTQANIATLNDETLKVVVAADGGIASNTCEIHFYYPADGTA